MSYVSTEMGDRLSELLVSVMALWLTLVDQNPFWPCHWISIRTRTMHHLEGYFKFVLSTDTVNTDATASNYFVYY